MGRIKKFWVLHRPSGICLFEQTFEELPGDADPFVISGFLFAISNISKDIAKQDIEFIQLNELRFSYKFHQHYVMILVTSKEMNHNHALQLIGQIQNEFEEEYPNILKESFSGDVSDFTKFATAVEKILNLEAKYYQFIDKRNKQLKEHFMDTDSMQWASIKQTIAKQAQSFGTWIIKHEMNVDSKLLKEISATRDSIKKVELSDEKNQDKNRSDNAWV